MIELAPAAAAWVLALVHLAARRLTVLSSVPRSAWLSVAGGVSVAYVFLHLLPELHEGQEAVGSNPLPVATESEIYLVALVGLVIFYGLERLAAASRAGRKAQAREDSTGNGAYLVHIGSFAVYNALIGYLLLHGERDNLAFYTAAMTLHFIVNDHALREHHKARYDRRGRWLLAAAVVGGWALGLFWEVSEVATHLAIALLAGGVILNVMKEELPEQRESRYWAFLLGAGGYGGLLLAM